MFILAQGHLTMCAMAGAHLIHWAPPGAHDPGGPWCLCPSRLCRLKSIQAQVAVPPLQAQRDSARYISFERKAALAEQAEALKRQIKESQLSSFRTEAKAR